MYSSRQYNQFRNLCLFSYFSLGNSNQAARVMKSALRKSAKENNRFPCSPSLWPLCSVSPVPLFQDQKGFSLECFSVHLLVYSMCLRILQSQNIHPLLDSCLQCVHNSVPWAASSQCFTEGRSMEMHPKSFHFSPSLWFSEIFCFGWQHVSFQIVWLLALHLLHAFCLQLLRKDRKI